MAVKRNAYFDAVDIALLAGATAVLVPIGAALNLMQVSGGYGVRLLVLAAFAPLAIRRMISKPPPRPPLRRGALASVVGIASVFAVVLGLLAVAVASWAASHVGDPGSDGRVRWEIVGGAGIGGFVLLGVGVLLDRARMVRRSTRRE